MGNAGADPASARDHRQGPGAGVGRREYGRSSAASCADGVDFLHLLAAGTHALDCEGSGGGEQGDGRQNQENHRLEVNRDEYGPLRCKDEAGLEPNDALVSSGFYSTTAAAHERRRQHRPKTDTDRVR
jgi:hypothetical protein